MPICPVCGQLMLTTHEHPTVPDTDNTGEFDRQRFIR